MNALFLQGSLLPSPNCIANRLAARVPPTLVSHGAPNLATMNSWWEKNNNCYLSLHIIFTGQARQVCSCGLVTKAQRRFVQLAKQEGEKKQKKCFYGEREKINILMQLFKLLPFHMNLIGASENSAEIKLKLISVHGADRLPHIHAAGSAHIKNGLGVFLLPLKAAGALAAAAFVYSAPNMSSPKSLPLINKHIRLC